MTLLQSQQSFTLEICPRESELNSSKNKGQIMSKELF